MNDQSFIVESESTGVKDHRTKSRHTSAAVNKGTQVDKTKAILITGAASGLGQATSHYLAQRGFNIAALDLSEISLDELPENAKPYQIDVSDTAAVETLCKRIADEQGGIGGLVNCAGIVAGGRLLSKKGPHDADVFRRVIEINLIGSFNTMRSAAENMAQNEPDDHGQRGVIVNTSSIAAYDGQIGQIAYAASKGALASMTLPAARDMASFGVRVVSIAPGVFDTAMMSSMPEEVREALEATVPFPSKLADPADFASLVLQIFENKTLNGEVIRLDGALRMGPR